MLASGYVRRRLRGRARPGRCVFVSVDEVYDVVVTSSSIKRTNINLDKDLVDAAAAVLGTVQTTETVHAALREVIARASRQRLAERDFPDLTPAALDDMRRVRRFA